jgi:large subunit ribosomal protein L4
LNKKLKQLARKSALAYKAKDNNITVLESFQFESPKTKNYINILDGLKMSGSKTLLVLADYNENIYRSGRNLPNTKIMAAKDLNTYDILHADTVIFIENSVGVIENILNKA